VHLSLGEFRPVFEVGPWMQVQPLQLKDKEECRDAWGTCLDRMRIQVETTEAAEQACTDAELYVFQIGF
jgi:hypothetical protein